MITASIDIGTNTILLLVADISNGVITRVLHDEQLIARLGRGVDANRRLLPETMERAAGYLQQYRRTAESLRAERIIAVGTSALRDAQNSREFCDFIKQTTGIEIQIISGDEEARWTYMGGISEFSERAEQFSVLDIGGGSTEVVTGTATDITAKRSFDLGCVRVTERFMPTAPPTENEIAKARSFIREMLQPVREFGVGATLAVAVAGTPTTLAAVYQHLPFYDRTRVTGFRLDRNITRELFDMMKGMTFKEIAALPQVSQGRADVLLAGVL
ncbi:MAG TPA: Ppx/GppA phosphatase family protein, partial [Bacteroidota bacterium]|nr:Ppx/GppA phosphatase family protein [Bacteroidota bacterium]